jgi:sigma-54 dependent transcriptional regulator, acetoin dehydrogenase operon transcriptional activator AcoR
MRIVIKVSTRRFVLLDAGEIYFLESDDHDTWVRTARKTRLRSVRSLGQLEKVLKPHGFVRVHKSYLVNLDRVREVRLRKGDDNDWELKLNPPVNSILPVGRTHLAMLKRSLGI